MLVLLMTAPIYSTTERVFKSIDVDLAFRVLKPDPKPNTYYMYDILKNGEASMWIIINEHYHDSMNKKLNSLTNQVEWLKVEAKKELERPWYSYDIIVYGLPISFLSGSLVGLWLAK